jgi:hypothetical protein
MTASKQTADEVATQGRWKWRLAVVVGAILVPLVVFLIADLALDGGVQTPANEDYDQASMQLNAGTVIFVAGLFALLAWGLLAILERITARGRTIWTVVAVVLFLLSLAGPFSGTDTNTGSRVALALLHLSVASVLTPFLPLSRRPGGGARSSASG